jgi:hypothetical protein
MLQAEIAAGRRTPDEINALLKSGDIELHDDQGSVAATAAARLQANATKNADGTYSPSPQGADIPPVDPTQTRNVMGAKYSYDPNMRGDEGAPSLGAAVGGYAKQGAKDVGEAAIGAGKTLVAPLYNLAKVFGYHDPDMEAALSSQNAFDKTGQIAGQTGQFMAGGALAAKAVAKALPALAATAPAAIAANAVGQGASGALVTKGQGGSNTEALINGGLSAVLPFVFKSAGAGAVAGGERMENTLLRPTGGDAADGFDVKNIFKYRLSGGIQKTAQKTADAIKTRVTDLANEIQKSGQAGNKIDLLGALTDTEGEIRAATQQGKNFSIDPAALDRAVNSFTDRIQAVTPNGVVDPVVAQSVKREVGNLGSWQYGGRDPDANAVERVSNTFFTKLRQAIDAGTNGRAGEINQQLSELLPIEQTLIRRVPVAQRNNIMNLGKVFLLGTGHPGLVGLEMASKSGTVANALVRGGQAVQGAGAPLTAATQAGVTSGNQ